jgi:hypothetical protein
VGGSRGGVFVEGRVCSTLVMLHESKAAADTGTKCTCGMV